MPAAARSLAMLCSQTRSGIHMPRTLAPKPIFRASAVKSWIWPTRSREGIIGQNRLVERPADDLDPPGGDVFRQPVEIFRMMRVEPFDQRAAGVQRDSQMRELLEHIQKRPVAVLVGLLEDAVEIADRLMIVQREDETESVVA